MSLPVLESRLSAAPVRKTTRVRVILQYLAALTDESIDAVGGPAVVKAQVLDLYDRYVAPLDNPWVPNLVEPVVDARIRDGVGMAVDAFCAAVDDDKE